MKFRKKVIYSYSFVANHRYQRAELVCIGSNFENV